MAIKLDEKGKERDIFALGFDEMETAAKKATTYNVVSRYWECVKKTYYDLIESQTDEEVIIDVLKVFNTPLHFNWRSDRIMIGNPPRVYGRNRMVEDIKLDDITFRIAFNERSFYYKLLKGGQPLEEDSKELKKYLKRSFLNKVKSARANVLKKQIVNASGNDYRINSSIQSMGAFDILRCSESRAMFEKVLSGCDITKEEFNNALSGRSDRYIRPGKLYYSAWQRHYGFEPCEMNMEFRTDRPIYPDLIGLIVGCEDLKIPLNLTLWEVGSPDMLSLDKVYEEFFNMVRNGFDTREELLLDIVKNQTIFENLVDRSELSSAHYVGLSLKDALFDNSNFEWVKIVKQ